MISDFHLFQLISPSLPIGSFSYSQGLEWAVEAGWVSNQQQFIQWLTDQLQSNISTLELPLIIQLMEAFQQNNWQQINHFSDWLIACRETSELRAEERQRGRALSALLTQLQVPIEPKIADAITQSQLVGYALACQHWQISIEKACQGYCWSWLENSVTNGIKLIPLGQSQGQKILLEISPLIEATIETAKQIDPSKIGSSTPALAIASSQHQMQYCRLYRS